MPQQSIKQMIALQERQKNEIERTLRLLYGELPAWFPLPRQESARRIIHRLTQNDFSAEQIAEFVTAEMCGNEIFYLYAHPTVARQDINELAHIKYALSLPDNECLEMLAGTLAVFALPFKRNSDIQRKPSPIRKFIARELANNPTLKPLQLWTILASKPPKGFSFFKNSLGKYIEIEGCKDVGWSWFSRVCKGEKDKIST